MKKLLCLCTCVLLVIMSFTGCGSASNVTTFLMADVQDGEHPSALACDKFAELVNDKTNGRIVIEVYHGDSLGSEKEQLQQIAVGGLDFARISSGQLSNYETDFKAFQALYLYSDESEMWDILDGEVGDELLNSEDLSMNNIVGLGWFSGGARNFYNNQREIHSPSDLKGLTFRANTDSLMKLLSTNGATGTNIAYNDILANIEDGTIEGAENNWASYISTGHYEQCKYITIDQHNCLPELLVASASALASLSEADQKIIKECAAETSDYQLEAMKEYEDNAIESAKEAGVTVTELTDEEKAAFQSAGAAINSQLFADYQEVITRITSK